MITLEQSKDENLREHFDKKEVLIDKDLFIYDSFYNKLVYKYNKEAIIACPVCYKTKFRVIYKDFNIYGVCDCQCEVRISG